MSPHHSLKIPIVSLLGLPLALERRVIRNAIKQVKKDLRRLSWDHIEAVRHLARGERPQASLNLPGKLTVKRTYGHLVFSPSVKRKPSPFHYTLHGTGTYDFNEMGRSLSIEEIRKRKGLRLRGSKWTAILDADKLRFPLTLRTFKAGDRFVPFGMQGHKKLKDFFMDLKVPLELRHSTPLLCCDDSVVWVCGFRIDDRFKVTGETKRVMKITMI